jgi:uncharacterized protein (TIGR02145 family)
MKRLLLFFLLTALVLSCERNTAPVIDSLIAEPDSVFPGDTVNITFRASDADGDGIHYMLGKSSGTWGTDFGSIEPTTWIAPKEPGDYYLTLMIGDLSDHVTDSVLVHVFDTVGFSIDARDGHQYKWVKIGSQFWMAENLSYLPAVSPPTNGSRTSPFYYVYRFEGDNVIEAKATDSYKIYGVLYNWYAAQFACPSGWHLPTDEEWKILEKNLGMSEADANAKIGWRNSGMVGGKLKESGTTHWTSPNTGANNTSGFTALPGGYRYHDWGFRNDEGFAGRGYYTSFWLSSDGGLAAMGWDLSYLYDGVYPWSGGEPADGFSVRCLKDEQDNR